MLCPPPPVTGCIVGVFISEYGVVLSGMAGLIVPNSALCAFKSVVELVVQGVVVLLVWFLMVLLECAPGVLECWSSVRVVNSVVVGRW